MNLMVKKKTLQLVRKKRQKKHTSRHVFGQSGSGKSFFTTEYVK
jgi:hypothetical protein